MLQQQFLAALIITATATVPVIAADTRRDLQSVTFCIIDIGRLPELPSGETFLAVNAINNRNRIVGWISVSGEGRTHAYLWDRRQGMRDLGVLPGHVNSIAADINNAGTVVGNSNDPETGSDLSFIWDRRNGLQALDASLGGDDHLATGINRSGQIVGASETRSNEMHAFLREANGDVLDLGAFPDGDGSSAATAVNDSGQVTGTSNGPITTEGFIWDERNGLQRLVPSSSLAILPNDINNRGEIVGSTVAETTRAFRWTAREGMEDLGSLGGQESDFAEAWGINRSGVIVGGSQVPGGAVNAFVWTRAGGMLDLNELIDPTSALASRTILRVAKAINDAGWIAAEGVDTQNVEDPQRGYLLAPRRHPGSPRCR